MKLSTTFSRHGYEVMSIGPGAEAVEWAQQYLPDLILPDLILPDLIPKESARPHSEGFAAARRVRA